ncbi:hypothetical protein [Halorubrum tibetense]|uniref:Uncharacterized protein n=1 Tax=Halorubrum tibetense TaxID=175631 RepID=A0ABD5SAP2_9EURY
MVTDQWLDRPLKEFIRTIAFSVAEGQEELDQRAMRSQLAIEREIEEGTLGYDLDASWLRFSEVEADLEMTLSIEGREIRDPETEEVRGFRPVVSALPLNHRVKHEYDVDAEIASEVRLRIAPVPPERRQR